MGWEPAASSCRDSSRCFRNFRKGHPRTRKGAPKVEFLLPPEPVVQKRVLELNLGLWEVKDLIRLLECPHGLTYALLGRIMH